MCRPIPSHIVGTQGIQPLRSTPIISLVSENFCLPSTKATSSWCMRTSKSLLIFVSIMCWRFPTWSSWACEIKTFVITGSLPSLLLGSLESNSVMALSKILSCCFKPWFVRWLFELDTPWVARKTTYRIDQCEHRFVVFIFLSDHKHVKWCDLPRQSTTIYICCNLFKW